MPSTNTQAQSTTRRPSLKDLVISTSSHSPKSSQKHSQKKPKVGAAAPLDPREKLKVRGQVFRVPDYQQVGSHVPKGELEAVSPGVSKLPKSVRDRRVVMAAFERRYGVGWDA
ncbi:hypothetical protein LTR86_009157 [Recurvomyces mirabilis]|nr:hypothetical protein LTR86_009157 [Recurvomyces mirabilis]